MQEILFRQIVENAPTGLFVIDLDFTIQIWNEMMEIITGIPSWEMIGSNLLDRFPEIAGTELHTIYQRTSTPSPIMRIEQCSVFTAGSRHNKQGYYSLNARVIGLDSTPKGCIVILEETTTRYFAERDLVESERRLSTLMDNLPGMAYRILNDEHWTLEFVSRGSMELVGYDSRYLQGNPSNQFSGRVHPEDQEKVRKTIDAAVASKKSFELFYRLQADNGVYKWVWEQGSGVFDDAGELIALEGYVNDFTTQKVMELELRRENERLRSSIKERYRFGEMIGKSEAMQKVYELILKAAATDTNVIVYGESGTGKELVAQAIHNLSDRSASPFVAVNCGAISEHLLESEFFGHVKGAFTGADRERKGYLDAAHTGTLFLDELGEISLPLQVKLLRVLDGRGYSPVGSTQVKTSDVRIIAATNRNLKEGVIKGKIRQDFFYRIHVLSIYLPRLKDRKEDIPLLIDHFLNKYRQKNPKKTIPQSIHQSLLNYPWPGNVRELQNTILRYVTLNEFDLIDVNPIRETENSVIPPEVDGTGCRQLKTLLESYEKQIILELLNQNQWKRGKVSQILGIDRKTLFTKMNRYHLHLP